MQLLSHDRKAKLPFIVPNGSTSRRFTTAKNLRLTPDAILKSKACPDVLLTSSRRKSIRGLRRLYEKIITKDELNEKLIFTRRLPSTQWRKLHEDSARGK